MLCFFSVALTVLNPFVIFELRMELPFPNSVALEMMQEVGRVECARDFSSVDFQPLWICHVLL